MCGRFVLVADPNVIQTTFNLDSTGVVDFAPRYNIAPTQTVPVITNEQPKQLSLLKWGLVPSWAKEEAIGNKMINARADGIADKPSFRNASNGGAALFRRAASTNGRGATARPRRRCSFT